LVAGLTVWNSLPDELRDQILTPLQFFMTSCSVSTGTTSAIDVFNVKHCINSCFHNLFTYVAYRTSIIRMSSDRKQDLGTKTVEDERIQVGVLRSSLDESEERDLGMEEDEEHDDVDDDDDDEVDNDDETNTSDDTGKSVHRFICLNFVLKRCMCAICTLNIIS